MNYPGPTLPPSSPSLTWQQVALYFVKQIEGIAFLGVIGVLAMKGIASTHDVVTSGFGLFLARSLPQSHRQTITGTVGNIAIIAIVIAASHAVTGCSP